MNSSRQVEVHYINTGFPYTVTESFMDLFEGLTFTQETTYWSTNAYSYKHGMSGSSSASYYGDNHAYEVNDYLARVDGSRRAWDHSSVMNGDGSPLFLQEGSTGIRSRNSAVSQMVWQDGIDPDNMTYEELLDLGEVVGNHNRGLSPECISSLPVSKYKCGFFLRRKSRCERCVICQMNYKRGDRQMILPCKHAFHASCVTRWLSINKACPICYIEVFSQERRD